MPSLLDFSKFPTTNLTNNNNNNRLINLLRRTQTETNNNIREPQRNQLLHSTQSHNIYNFNQIENFLQNIENFHQTIQQFHSPPSYESIVCTNTEL